MNSLNVFEYLQLQEITPYIRAQKRITFELKCCYAKKTRLIPSGV